ncbi:hypothetical protein PENTCL1PPCAC_15983, partial [Pristionchus entomophagus]
NTLKLLKDPSVASRFAVHILFEKAEKLSCDHSRHRIGDQSDEGIFFASYPINTVRNVARLFSFTRYVAFADSDYLFSAGFYEKMLAILRENVPIESRNALLYRIFEVDEVFSRLRNHQLTKVDLK